MPQMILSSAGRRKCTRVAKSSYFLLTCTSEIFKEYPYLLCRFAHLAHPHTLHLLFPVASCNNVLRCGNLRRPEHSVSFKPDVC